MTAGSLLDALESERRLLDAWEDVLRAGSDDGPPSAELADWAETAATRVADIAAAFRDRTWRPSPVVSFQLSKPSGGVRNLAIPSISDRVVERALLELITPLVDPLLSPWSFGYRRGVGVNDAIRALVEARDDGLQVVLRVDIKDFFDNVPRWELLRRLGEVLTDPPVVVLVGDLMARRLVGRNAPRLRDGRGLHQGSPLSPLLANLYLDAFDRAMMRCGWMAIRFGDDMAIPVSTRADAERALDDAREALESLGLELNLGKTHIRHVDQGVEFLGQTIGSATGRGVEPSSSPLETTVFVVTEGSWIRTRGKRVVVQNGEEVLLRLHPNRVRQVVTIGRVGLTTSFLRFAAVEGIDVVLLDETSGMDSRLMPRVARDPRARITQYRAADRTTQSLDLATQFVLGKIQNMRVGLMKRRPATIDDESEQTGNAFDVGIEQLSQRRAEAAVAATYESLLGTEGSASRAYFQVWERILAPQWQFEGRRRRPPPDAINAMLSFTYTLLTNEAVAACEAAQLDPDIGFLHRPQPGRPSLALDLVEEFRPLIADSVVFGIVRRNMLSPDDFVATPDRGCRMRTRAKRVLIGAYEERLLRLTAVPTTDRRMSWRMAMHSQAKHLAAVLRGDVIKYQPTLWK